MSYRTNAEVIQEMLPPGFRIQQYLASSDWVDGEGYYAHRLERWMTWTEAFWWWKREVTGWRTIERNNHYEPLIETAWMMVGGRPKNTKRRGR